MGRGAWRALVWSSTLGSLVAVACAAWADDVDPYQAGLERLDAGDAAAAIALFEDLSNARPDDPLAHYWLGVAAVQTEQDLLAAGEFARAAELDPELPFVQADLGFALYRLDDLGAAEIHLLEALLQGPEDADVLLHLGLIDAHQDRPQRAIRLFREAAELDPEVAALAQLEAAHVELERGDLEAAIAALELAVAAPGPAPSRASAAELLALLAADEAPPHRIALRAGAGVEYDDNVTLSAQDFSTGEGDVAGVFDAGIDLYVVRDQKTALYVGYDFYQSLYQVLSDFDLQTHSPHVVFENHVGRFAPRVAYRYVSETLGGDSYLDGHRLDLAVETRLFSDVWYGLLGVRFDHVDFAWTPLRDADRTSLPIGTRVHLRDGLLVLGLGWEPEWTDARGPQFSYDAQNVSARATILLPVGDRTVDFNTVYTYTDRDYTGITLRIRQKRHDSRHLFTIGAALPLARNLEAIFDYAYFRSASNLPESNYSENIVTFRLEAWY